jgi:hypothetical protein
LDSGETKSIVAPEPILEITAGHQTFAESKVDKKPVVAPVLKPEIKSAPASKIEVPIKKSPPSSPAKLIVQKPEANRLIKKIFADGGLAAKGAVRIANISEDAGVAAAPFAKSPLTTAKTITSDVAAKPSRPVNTAAARNTASNEEPVNGRKQMHDIKPIPKIMGPLEELQFLDLTNFRRLGKTPEEITAKILNKIKLLEHDGYEKMIMGISAWRKSPVSRLYLKIVSEAVSVNLPLKDAIIARDNRKEEGLSLAEIEAIMSLNSKLVF